MLVDSAAWGSRTSPDAFSLRTEGFSVGVSVGGTLRSCESSVGVNGWVYVGAVGCRWEQRIWRSWTWRWRLWWSTSALLNYTPTITINEFVASRQPRSQWRILITTYHHISPTIAILLLMLSKVKSRRRKETKILSDRCRWDVNKSIGCILMCIMRTGLKKAYSISTIRFAKLYLRPKKIITKEVACLLLLDQILFRSTHIHPWADSI